MSAPGSPPVLEQDVVGMRPVLAQECRQLGRDRSRAGRGRYATSSCSAIAAPGSPPVLEQDVVDMRPLLAQEMLRPGRGPPGWVGGELVTVFTSENGWFRNCAVL